MAAYGFFGDVMQDSEKLRWMGPKRYDLSGFKKFMSNRYKISYIFEVYGTLRFPQAKNRLPTDHRKF